MVWISNIERFATHDGFGIRTTVFFKGCPLRCPWCANPETWTVTPVLMHDEKKCTRCGQCKKVCDANGITWNDRFTWLNPSLKSIREYEKVCPNEAFSVNGEMMSAEEIIDEVMKDEDYYHESHGGMTLSGGECFMQFDGMMELLKLAKKKKLHTAVETTGNYAWEKLEEAEPYIDLFLYDIKHLDTEVLKNKVNGDRDLILSNLRKLSAKRGKDVIIRIPVIPDFNLEIVEEVIRLGEELQVLQINLLPYHSLGKTKWHQLHRQYEYENLIMMKREELAQYESDFVKIGG